MQNGESAIVCTNCSEGVVAVMQATTCFCTRCKSFIPMRFTEGCVRVNAKIELAQKFHIEIIFLNVPQHIC